MFCNALFEGVCRVTDIIPITVKVVIMEKNLLDPWEVHFTDFVLIIPNKIKQGIVSIKYDLLA